MKSIDGYGWAILGIGILMLLWVILTTVFGTFTGGPFPS
jgi:hypothetical protein